MNPDIIKKFTIDFYDNGKITFSSKPCEVKNKEFLYWYKYSITLESDLLQMLLNDEISIHSCILKTHEYLEVFIKCFGIYKYNLVHKNHFINKIINIFNISLMENHVRSIKFLDYYFENKRYPDTYMDDELQITKKDLYDLYESVSSVIYKNISLSKRDKTKLDKIKIF